MSESSAAKNLKRIAESVEQHDSSCKVKAKAVMLNPYEFERLGFDSITLKTGRKVPIKSDDSLGTGRLRVVCDGYHGPKRKKEQEETVEAPAPAERELVPAGAPGETWPHRGGPKGAIQIGKRSGKTLHLERFCLAFEEHNPDAEKIKLDGVVLYRLPR